MSGRFAKPVEQKRRITFADVAGQDQAKREVSELVDFLRDPERFEKVGAEVPHGVLLMGPPGTGKTLLARALAGEAEVPFFSTSGSEFIEVFVGVGAGRRAAEKLLLGSLSSGADDDIRRATELARSMVARWGMNAEIGPVDLRESEDHPFLGQTIAQPRTFSDATAARVDAAVADLLCDPEAEASRLIESHRNQVARLVERLEAEESLDAAAIRACLAPDDKVTPLLANSRRAEPELGAGD